MKLNHIYIIRFIAALTVVFYHFGSQVFPFNQPLLNGFIKFGNEAVNLFFILSGFIMVVAYYKPERSDTMIDRKKYWLNRFARIYPVYFLSLLLIACYYFFIDRTLFTSFYLRFPLEVVLLQSWIGKSSLNFPGWSLSVEMFFYLAFPYLLLWLVSKKPAQLILVATIAYVVIQALSIYLFSKYAGNEKAEIVIKFFPLMHMSTFISGAVLGIIFVRYYKQLAERMIIIKLLGYLFAIGFILLAYFSLDLKKYHYNGLLAPAYFCFLFAFALESKITRVMGNRFFIYLGDISYSLYILQFPVWAFYTHYAGDNIADKNLFFYGYLILLILASCLIYSVYEKTAQVKIKNWFDNRRRVAI
jgi:peptidoglycan/LPS O-acetylase OafA/YrhL